MKVIIKTRKIEEEELINRGEQPEKVLIDRDALDRLIYQYSEHLDARALEEGEQSQAEIECSKIGLHSFRHWLDKTSALVSATKGTWLKATE
jgi:DNA transposition AAA+ family ATPase